MCRSRRCSLEFQICVISCEILCEIISIWQSSVPRIRWMVREHFTNSGRLHKQINFACDSVIKCQHEFYVLSALCVQKQFNVHFTLGGIFRIFFPSPFYFFAFAVRHACFCNVVSHSFISGFLVALSFSLADTFFRTSVNIRSFFTCRSVCCCYSCWAIYFVAISCKHLLSLIFISHHLAAIN